MKSKIFYSCVAACLISTVFCYQSSFARERRSSGSYSGRSGNGTFQRTANRDRGRVSKELKWQNDRGEGGRTSEKNWDRTSGTGTYSSKITSAGGGTLERSGSAVKNDDGSFTKTGTIIGPSGRTADVSGSLTRNQDGTFTSSKSYTGPEGAALDVSKTIEKTDSGLKVSGGYGSSTGKSGIFESSTTISDGTITKEQSLTNQDQETWTRTIDTYGDGDTVKRDITTKGPGGEGYSQTQSITFDQQ